MEVGKSGVQRRSMEGAVPAPVTLGLLGAEIGSGSSAVPVVEFMGGEGFPGSTQQAVLLGRQGNIPEPAQLSRCLRAV